ncbi:MAG: NAD-dependent epimerase/dehydratase family protein [Lentisphaeria bacterium]
MNITIFGAAGWVGRAVVETLQHDHTLTAFDLNAESWEKWDDLHEAWDGCKTYGDITDAAAVDAAVAGSDAIVHAAVFFSQFGNPDVDMAFRVNVQGLWHVLESARLHGVRRFVHVGSCHVQNPHGVFNSGEVRRPDWTLYAATKRLQEEMCRHFHDDTGAGSIVLRPDSIVDCRRGIDMFRRLLIDGFCDPWPQWICRWDLAQAVRLALTVPDLGCEILHVVNDPGAAEHCNVERTREILGWEPAEDFLQYIDSANNPR